MTGRFDVVLGSDIKPEAIQTFEENHTVADVKPAMIKSDIRKVQGSDLFDALKPYGITRRRQLACLMGGPPCEGFSQNRSLKSGGRPTPGASSRIDKFIQDPRNQLFRWFVEAAKELQPAVVVIENVPDLIRHRDGETRDEIMGALADAGYRTNARILHAADFGVPQMRRRAFFIAQRQDDYDRTGLQPDFPTPTHRAYPLGNESLNQRPDWLPGDSGYWTTVREAIGDLPPAFDSDDFNHSLKSYPQARLTGLRSFLRAGATGVPYHHLARPVGASGLRRIQALRSGQRAGDLPDELKTASSYHYSYSRLRWAEPARTITKFAYNISSGMFTHPDEDRAITMREAARLQTFPDWFKFSTSRIRELSALIGSAVPPLLASRIALQVVRYLDELTLRNLAPEVRIQVRKQETDAVLKRLEGTHWTSDIVTGQQADLFGDEAPVDDCGVDDDLAHG